MRKGLALVLVVGTLGILAVLGSAFVVLSRMERRSAQQRLLSTRALLLARSGLEDAQARLDLWQDPGYGGEDWNGDGTLNAGPETAGQVYRASALDRDACPAGQALRPSFFKSVGGNPRTVPVDGRPRGLSGHFEPDASHWSLKVLAGGFHVNDTHAQLRRMLGVLAEAVGRQDGTGLVQADGEALVDLRPPGGWTSEAQIRDLALGGSQAKLDALSPYLTLAAWVDRKVVAPNIVYASPTSFGTVREGYKLSYAQVNPGSRAPGFEARAPVDLAWARTHRPALIALLANLRGVWLDEYARKRRAATIALDWSKPTDDCRIVADFLLGSTCELRTWEQWNAFCDTVPVTALSDVEAGPAMSTSDIRNGKRSILMASFNPNTDANKFNPDAAMYRLVDKCDLLAYSTELSLLPLGGERIVSVGRILSEQGRLLASRTLTARRSPDRAFRLTAQSEMVAEDLGNPDVAGDEGAFRAYGSSPYIPDSLGAGRTFGHKILGTLGTSLQTGPEPHTVSAPAAWDGQLRLATTETDDGQYAVTGTSMMFLARFDEGYDGDYSGENGNLTAYMDEYGGLFPKTPDLSVWDAVAPANLLPDGCFSEMDPWMYTVVCSPGYESMGNLHAHRGAASFWVKLDYDRSKASSTTIGLHGGHVYFNNSRSVSPNALNPGGTAMFCFLHVSNDLYVNCWAQFWENRGGLDGSHENCHLTPGRNVAGVCGTPSKPHRWYLQTYSWDAAEQADDNGRVLIDRGLQANAYDHDDSEYYGGGGPRPCCVDYRLSDGVTPIATGGWTGCFFLGPQGQGPGDGRSINSWHSPTVTMDEFAIYDLGAGALGFTRAETLAQDRFVEGRYYKESAYPSAGGLAAPRGPLRNAGEWFSAPVALGPGPVRLHRLAWTQIVPRGLRSPGPAGWPPVFPADPAKPEDGDPGPDGRIALELADAAGTGYKIGGLFEYAPGERVARPLSGPFRLHAVFQPNLQDPNVTAILDPLVLDDVTLVYREPALPPVLSWGEGE